VFFEKPVTPANTGFCFADKLKMGYFFKKPAFFNDFHSRFTKFQRFLGLKKIRRGKGCRWDKLSRGKPCSDKTGKFQGSSAYTPARACLRLEERLR
jgi:hypothetical protein